MASGYDGLEDYNVMDFINKRNRKNVLVGKKIKAFEIVTVII